MHVAIVKDGRRLSHGDSRDQVVAHRDFIEDSRDAASQHVLLQQRQLERRHAVAELRFAGLICENQTRIIFFFSLVLFMNSRVMYLETFTWEMLELLEIYLRLRTTPHYIHLHHLLGTSYFALH